MDDIAIIILAAGAARRMGHDKLLLPVQGSLLLRHVAEQALATNAPLTVVIPANTRQRAAALDGLALNLLTIPDPKEGMAASLRAGLAAMPDNIQAVVIALADMPEVRTEDYDRLFKAYKADPGQHIQRAATCDGKPGNPVLLPKWAYAGASFSGDRGARDLLKRHRDRTRLVPLPGRRAVLDIDTPKDWRNWQATLG